MDTPSPSPVNRCISNKAATTFLSGKPKQTVRENKRTVLLCFALPKIKCAWLPPEKEAAFLCLIPRS